MNINEVGCFNVVRAKFVNEQRKRGIKIVKLAVAVDGVEIYDARSDNEICISPLPLGGFVRGFDNHHFVVTEPKYQSLIREFNVK